MNNKLHFEIVTPEKVAFRDEIDSITLPTSEGEITILPKHIPLVTIISPGEIVIKKEGKIHHMAVMRGFLEKSGETIKLITDAAELADEIDERRAEEAKQRAQKAKEAAKNEVEITEATVALERALTRIKVAQRKKHRHSSTM